MYKLQTPMETMRVALDKLQTPMYREQTPMGNLRVALDKLQVGSIQ
jgi:hypothetical protein